MSQTKADTPLGRNARRVVDAIENHPGSFWMDNWWDGPGAELAPDAPVDASVAMCAGGWILHLKGWTLTQDGRAVKDGTQRDVAEAAIEAFEPSDERERFCLIDLFDTDESRAWSNLHYVADHGTFPPGGIFDDEFLEAYAA